eukprot:CAMPEP_0184028364 /NCGR_PEP_ID=MMETSP0954-20121128/14786_1 /TAXON_ID=627963 /ORGANISM="Aplanochytrium sp, Strain PBS07" /LENGTH=412 /DNA_ID=CAMNT_0026313173 /DNA_START=142 /DNA_END=1380 /DNA_ORIENTATION=+
MAAYLRSRIGTTIVREQRFAGWKSQRNFSHAFDSTLTNKDWENKLGNSVDRVNLVVDNSLSQIRKSRDQIGLWDKAFRVIQTIASSPKKHMFRPQLVVLGYAGATNSESDLSDPPDGIIQFASGIEMHHLFMLVHDDMMDGATFRRGEETLTVALCRSDSTTHLNQETAQYLATIVGDILFAKSSELMLKGAALSNSSSSVDIVLEAAIRAGGAQFEDILGWSGLGNKKENDQAFERIMSDKAAYHGFVAPLIAGIRLSNQQNNKDLETACTLWGLRAGAAFQGLDDISDLTQSPVESGKDQLQDIHEGRLSLPLFLLRDRASEDELNRIAEILRMNKANSCPLSIPDRIFLFDLIEKYKLIKEAALIVEAEIKAAECVVKEREAISEVPILQEGLNVFNAGLRKALDKLVN